MLLSRRSLRKLESVSQLPALFRKSRRTFWTERYVSKHILNAHLDPSTDDASRPPQIVDESTAWIAAQVGGGPGRRLIDLGCGPGLYCSKFNSLGFDVTGIDFSKHSIAYAKKTAAKKGELISYLLGDYLTADLPLGFDVATLIYGDFCVLSDHDRDLLLWKLRRVLNPGGYFVFDVFTERYERSRRLKTDWYFQVKNGFWHRHPHLVLEQSHQYPADETCLNQYILLLPWLRPRVYHIWHHYYSLETMTEVLRRHRFKILGAYGDLAGSPLKPDSEWIGVVCRRED